MAGVERAVVQLAEDPTLGVRIQYSITRVQCRQRRSDPSDWLSAGRQILALAADLRRSRPPVAVVAVSQNCTGLLRDCAFIILLWAHRVRVYGWVHGEQLPRYLSSGLVGRCFLYPLKLVNSWIVPSPLLERDIARMFPDRRIVAIPHPIDLDLFAPPEYPTVPDVDVAFVGKIAATKGWHDFLAAVTSLESELEVVEVVGEFIPLERNLVTSKGRMTSLGTSPPCQRWTFRDFASDDELVSLYHRSRVLVIPVGVRASAMWPPRRWPPAL